MTELLSVVLPTFIIVGIGFLFGKFKKPNMSVVSELVIWIGLPALVITSMLDKKIELANAAKIWGSAVFLMIVGMMIAWVVFKAIRQKHSGLYLPIGFMNAVNIPFPIIYLVYGSEGLYAATLYMIPCSLLTYSLGIYIASGKNWKNSLKEVFKIPPIYASAIGLTLNFANVQVPDIILRPLEMVGLMTIPLVLLVLGNNLSKIKAITSVKTTLLASFLRLGVGLALGFLVVWIFNLEGVLRSVILLESAMPAAVNATIITTKYNNESELVSSVVFITTVASLVIIPFLLNYLGF